MTTNVFTRSSYDTCISTQAQPGFESSGGPLRRLARMLSVWYDRETSRRQLLRLDTRALRDIGITAAQARTEGERPFWQL